MFQVPLATSSTCLSSISFWNAVNLYHNRPHLVNRRLTAVSQILFLKVSFSCKGIKHVNELFTKSAILYEIRRLKELSREFITEEFVRNILECYDKNLRLISINEKQFEQEQDGIYISVRILLPRSNYYNKCMELVVLDKDENIATFLAVSEKDKLCLAPPFKYQLELSISSNLRINIKNFEDADTAQAEWLADRLFTKLLNWSEDRGSESEIVKSLSLISVSEYCSKYAELKEKYGNYLIEEWPKKTTTNPQKYIFEDLAIASYLICLWCSSPKASISFVDCGCGNGLLVYILNKEGYDGYGIDIRRRPTWDIYPSDVQLEVGTVTPESLFPKSTWLIGNHSDELTPWMPVIALKSSPTTNFFVLPCCPYDFSGKKYIRTNTAISQYSDYLGYVRSISEKCRFKIQIDKLRIPSTKRTCLVGIRNFVSAEEHIKIIEDVDEFIISRMPENFIPRNDVEQVRNCTQLEKDLVQRLLNAIVDTLLGEKNFILKGNGQPWNKGTCIPLSELSKRVDRIDLKQLKNECGGLQTLLRNHRYIFQIVKGCASLREPLKYDDTKKYKSKSCWFLKNHPDGCLFESSDCAYFHNVEK